MTGVSAPAATVWQEPARTRQSTPALGISSPSWEAPGVDSVYLLWASYIGLGVMCTIAELVRPARKLRYAKALPLDLVALVAFQFAMFPIALYVTEPLPQYIPAPAALLDLWLPLRIALFYLLADLGSYWMHRLMHTRHVWRVHRWHHSSERLYWLSGVRTTIPQQILFNLPTAIAVPILIGAPAWVALAIPIEGIARNHWMHMNVSWRSNWLEYVFVTPRFHHIHHSTDATQHDGNYGSLLSIWDRLFGTYLDPDVTHPRQFGTGERKRDPVLLMIGV
jgi:sterol desaturase/sphingolipid hydroxylase (fatty acid hydroxylase superfamily)